MCLLTRFQEAIPLRNIKAPKIAKALIKFFTLFGLSKSVQSDQGPLSLSITKEGNQYLLTIMCLLTRFQEAIPLRNIKAPKIAKALIKFFTLFGLSKSVQSDQGSNFMSHLFQDVMAQLGIKQVKSSAYHSQSQGL